MTFFDFLFGLLLLLGIATYYPFSFRAPSKNKKNLWTASGILIHLGIYGLLWTYVPFYAWVGLILAEVGGILLIDPLKLFSENQKQLGNAIGGICLGLSAIIVFSSFTHFPLWLWALPVLIFLISKAMEPTHPYRQPLVAISIIMVLLFLVIMSYLAYKNVAIEDSPAPTNSVAAPASQPLSDMHLFQGLTETERLEVEVSRLRKENASLREALQKQSEKIEAAKEAL